MKSVFLIILMFFTFSLFSQIENKNILLIHAAQRDSQNGKFPSTGVESWYGETSQMSVSDATMEYIAEYLQGLLSLTDDYASVQVDFTSEGYANSIADIYYDPEFNTLKSTIINGNYKYVIFFDSEQAYTYPEIIYEACKQFSQPILEAGGTPMLMMSYSTYVKDADQLGTSLYRAANGNGIELIPAGYAITEAGLKGRRVGKDRAEQAMISASAIYKKITGLNAEDANYTPTYEHTDISSASQYALSASTITTLATYATNAVDTHKNTEHYNTSYETDGAVVYRNLDVSATTPFNNEVKYFYKGTSTHDHTSYRLDTIINTSLTATARKLSKQVYGTRDWTVDDTTLRESVFEDAADLGVFLYVGGSDPGANAQDIIDSNQAIMLPLVFDWIKGFEGTGGVASTTNALNNENCAALWYNYHFRGWKTIPLTVGMGRLNETFSNFIAADDALHISDPLVYMNAAMMIASSMGTKLPVVEGLPTRRGTWTQTQLKTAMDIGHDLIKELAYMSETFDHVPDSNISIETKTLPKTNTGHSYTHQLTATGGTGNYTWEVISNSGLPNGLTLSSNGTISGITTGTFDIQNIAFKVTDEAGSFRKTSLALIYDENLSTSIINGLSTQNINIYPNPVKNGLLNVLFSTIINSEITIKLFTSTGILLLKQDYKNDKNVKLDVNSIPTGVYFLKVITGETSNTQKIIINKEE